MSHDFKPEPHEKAMIDVMLKGNTTPKWIYDFNKFLIEERTTGEIIKFIDELLHQELQKAREQIYKDLLSKLDGYKVIDGVSFEGSLPPAEIFTEMLEDTNLIRDHVNGVIDFIKKDLQSELDQPIELFNTIKKKWDKQAEDSINGYN